LDLTFALRVCGGGVANVKSTPLAIPAIGTRLPRPECQRRPKE
jgi:hypothetical protein